MSQNSAHCYEFGPYRLDLGQRILTRSGDKIALTPKATQLLSLLVSHAGSLVDKDELLKEVWANTFVDESNLTQNIFLLRRALGDERPGTRYIETVPRRGYRFVASVRVIGEAEAASDGPEGHTASEPRIIAVLPFVNETGDEDVEYVADGLTENIVNNLSRVSKLRVMSRSAVFRYKKRQFDPRTVGKELGVDVVLVGKINVRSPGKSDSVNGESDSSADASIKKTRSRSSKGSSRCGCKVSAQPSEFSIGVELVQVGKGWQLWGESFDCELKDLLEIQDTITHQLLGALKLKLSGDEEKRITARYTENSAAYQSYLEGRYHWSKYTRTGIEKAITHFREAIELDPTYALSYAGIIDCYLRLATNYLPPEEDVTNRTKPDGVLEPEPTSQFTDNEQKIKLRCEWDCKSAERELRRAHELKTEFPAVHQWYAGYRDASQIVERSTLMAELTKHEHNGTPEHFKTPLSTQINSLSLTADEEVQIYCAIAREQIDAGNYEAASLILKPRWEFSRWPKLDELVQHRCADLLFTSGQLSGWLASTRQLPNGQKHGEELLSGSIAFCEQLGLSPRAAEGRIELALCYYRQGLFSHARATLVNVLNALSVEDVELRTLALIRLAVIERDAGRLTDALSCLHEAAEIGRGSGPWATGRCHIELASTYKELAIAQEAPGHFNRAKEYYGIALYEFEAVGNHRLAASTENNLGYMLLLLGELRDGETHLRRARRAFDSFGDLIRRAQVDDSLAHLYLAQGKPEQAYEVIAHAVAVTEKGDEDLLLAKALTTKGLIYCRLGRYDDAKRVLEDAHRLASRCGDSESAGCALLVLIEETGEVIGDQERQRIGGRLVELLSLSERPVLRRRLQRCLEIISHPGSGAVEA
ncbi:MAG TPA: winged helix-turn-helix domain-containing protein [Pyrinomonadaceae bacterium]|nr:winged helix-turn-helix domain-containing protein [Pyrinomonadaceae bacterium]